MSDLIYLLKDIIYVNLNTGALKKKKAFPGSRHSVMVWACVYLMCPFRIGHPVCRRHCPCSSAQLLPPSYTISVTTGRGRTALVEGPGIAFGGKRE